MPRRLPLLFLFALLLSTPSIWLGLNLIFIESPQRAAAQALPTNTPCIYYEPTVQIAPTFPDIDAGTPDPNAPIATVVPTRVVRGVPCTPTPRSPRISTRTLTPTYTVTVAPITQPVNPYANVDPGVSCSSPSQPINYEDFSNTTGLCLVANAARVGTVLRLAPAAPNQVGAVWYGTRQRVNAGFESVFQFKIRPGSNSADGIAFVIQGEGPNIYGQSGCGIGYDSIQRSIAVEFDTKANVAGGVCFLDPDWSTPTQNHISIQSRGLQPNSPSHDSGTTLDVRVVPPFDNDYNVTHTARVRYSAATRYFSVELDGASIVAATIPNNQSLKQFLGLPDDYAYVGFTSATGGENADHDILNWRFTTADTFVQPDTVGVYRYDTSTNKGSFYLRNSNSEGNADISATLDFANSASGIPLVGDWNNDGIDTVGIYIGNAFKMVDVNESASTATITGTFGIASDIPVVGDWDGDGYDTLALFRTTGGGNTWYFSNTILTGTNLSLTVFSEVTYGLSTDKPLAGDWDGDGIDTIGVFRPSTAEFILSNTRLVSGTQPPLLADIQFGYGISSDTPIVGAWNGKPVPGPAVFRDNTWLQRYSLSSGWADASFGYGISTDKPVAGRWTSVCGVSVPGGFAPPCLQATPTIAPSPTITLTAIPTLTPTSTATGCNIRFTTQFFVREKGNQSGYKLGQVSTAQLYPAFHKSPPSLDNPSQVWVQIQFSPQIIGWIQAVSGSTSYVDPDTQSCFNALPIYLGSFPAGWDQVSRITQVEISQAGSHLAYLFTEGQVNRALLLSRLAISESGSATETFRRQQYRSEAELISWTVRMRAFIGLLNYNAPGTLRSLQLTSGLVKLSSSGRAGDTTSVEVNIVFSVLITLQAMSLRQ